MALLNPVSRSYNDYKDAPKQARFNPYEFHAGTIVAIAGEDYAVIASDTRLSQGFSIHSRDSPKVYNLSKTTALACMGFHGDVLTLTKHLKTRQKMYLHEHNKEMSTSAIAAMLSTMLYHRRFFPYYTYNLVAGLDAEGKGVVYSFDPVGSYEAEHYRAGGSAAAMLQPLLDNQLGGKNQKDVSGPVQLSSAQCVNLVHDLFVSASERDIFTGDSVQISVINASGVDTQSFKLRRD